MSEAPRTYMSWGQSSGFSGGRRRGLRPVTKAALAAGTVFFAFAFLVSRDTHPAHEFIARDQGIQLIAQDVMKNRDRVARAPLWSSIPGTTQLNAIRELLENNFGFPEWMLRNFVGGDVIVTGNDVDRMSDLLFITKMTTVGCVIQRVNRLLPGVTGDWAGGLKLRKLVEEEVWYTVRGRTLIASASRDALVHALTLSPEGRAGPESFQQMMAGNAAVDAWGTLRLDAKGTLGRVFDSMRFSLSVDDSDRAALIVRGNFRPEWQERLAQTLHETTPTELQSPFDGPIAVSGNFGLPVKDLWLTLGELLDAESMSRDRWETWESGDGQTPIEGALTALLGPAGPGFTFTWQGMDMNEIAPTPLIFGTVEAEKARVLDFLEGLPKAPNSPAYREAFAYYDADLERFHAPIMSGPSMAPTAAWHGDELLFSTSRRLAESRLAETPVRGAMLSRRANLYISIRPLACMRILARTGQQLAGDGLLRNYTAQEFREASEVWIEEASSVDEATLWLTVNNEAAELELFVSPSRVSAPLD